MPQHLDPEGHSLVEPEEEQVDEASVMQTPPTQSPW
jgi:hypothetical protein